MILRASLPACFDDLAGFRKKACETSMLGSDRGVGRPAWKWRDRYPVDYLSEACYDHLLIH